MKTQSTALTLPRAFVPPAFELKRWHSLPPVPHPLLPSPCMDGSLDSRTSPIKPRPAHGTQPIHPQPNSSHLIAPRGEALALGTARCRSPGVVQQLSVLLLQRAKEKQPTAPLTDLFFFFFSPPFSPPEYFLLHSQTISRKKSCSLTSHPSSSVFPPTLRAELRYGKTRHTQKKERSLFLV